MMMMSTFDADRRNYPRYSVNFDTQIITPEFYISVNTLEISVDGLRIEAYSEILPGTDVTISFEFKKDISFYGKVVWVIGFHKKEILKYLIGIKIHEVTLSGIRIIGYEVKDELIKDILKKMKKAGVK
jgi:PilZ domain